MASEGYYTSSSSSYNDTSPFAYIDQPSHSQDQLLEEFSSAGVHFQMPHYLYSTAPALASGGGAEVLPAGMLNETNWLINNGFPPMGKQGKQKQVEAWHDSAYDVPDSGGRPGLAPTAPRGPFDFDIQDIPAQQQQQRSTVRLSVPSPTHPTHLLFSPTLLEHFLSQSQHQSQDSQQQHSQLGEDEDQQSSPKPHPPAPVTATSRQAAPPPPPSPSSRLLAPSPVDKLSIVPATRLLPPPPPSFGTGPPGVIHPVYYSATGFDILSILARVFSRPYPRVNLGPVDLTCSFVVVDVRRHDSPIVYCSPTFCKLTGYEEREILGRNCRFLQSPTGVLEPGGEREDEENKVAVAYLKKCLVADKECQTTMINYKKDGTPFRNLLTVIPIHGGVDGKGPVEEGEQEVVFHVGFQVDLTEQPKAILENMKQGSYLMEKYPPNAHAGGSGALGVVSRQGVLGSHQSLVGKDNTRKSGHHFAPVLMSKELKRLMSLPGFLRAVPITTETNVPVPIPSSGSSVVTTNNSLGTGMDTNELLRVYGGNHPIHMILLELGPDFVHVVSLKGSFLYVAPSVRRVLGYEPEELVGASFADLAHPEDLVPLMRELKESSTTSSAANSGSGGLGGSGAVVPGTALTSGGGGLGSGDAALTAGQQGLPRNVSLMFRAKTRNGIYVWVESRGRLHVEPGKGRKAIILTGRAREMGNVSWETLLRGGGGVAKSVVVQRPRRYLPALARADASATNAIVESTGEVEDVLVRQEFWGVVSTSMVLMNVGSGIRDVLGFSPEEFTSKSFEKLLTEPCPQLESHIKQLGKVGEGEYDARWASVRVRMKLKEGFVPPTTRSYTDEAEDEGSLEVIVNVFRMQRDRAVRHVTQQPGGISPAHLLYQVRVASAEVHPITPAPSSSAESPPRSPSFHHHHQSTSPPSVPSPSQPTPSPSTSREENATSSTTPAPFPIDLKSNLFDALDISKGSSWQYELQQLKFGNQKLREEVMMLSAAIRAKKLREQQVQRQLQRERVESVEREARKRAMALQFAAQGRIMGGPGRERRPVSAPWVASQQAAFGAGSRGGSGASRAMGGLQQPPQSQHGHQQSMFNELPGLSLNLSPYVGGQAALPMRTSTGGYGMQHPSSPEAAPPFLSSGSGVGGGYGQHHQLGVNDYLGTSPYIQRVQEEIASMYHQGPSTSSGVKRGWDGMPRGG